MTQSLTCHTMLSFQAYKGAMMEFYSRFINPYRAPREKCERCGRPALHQGRRDDMRQELCCDCFEAISGETCLGHELATPEGSGKDERINIMCLSDEQIETVWTRISCVLHGLCVPSCMRESGAYGCCLMCDHEFEACPERCPGFK